GRRSVDTPAITSPARGRSLIRETRWIGLETRGWAGGLGVRNVREIDPGTALLGRWWILRVPQRVLGGPRQGQHVQLGLEDAGILGQPVGVPGLRLDLVWHPGQR